MHAFFLLRHALTDIMDNCGSFMPTHLVWFRADLRIHDNFALAAACRAKDANVLALFIATPEQWRQHDMAPGKRHCSARI